MMIVPFIGPRCEHCGGVHTGRGGHPLTARADWDEKTERCRRAHERIKALELDRFEHAQTQRMPRVQA